MSPIRSLNVLDLISPFIKCKRRKKESKQKFSTEMCCFPLICSNLGEDDNHQQQNMNDEDGTLHSSSSVDSGVNHQEDDNMSYWSAEEDEAPYSGPLTRSMAKTQETTALNKTNTFVASYFSDWFILKSVSHVIAGTASKWFR